MRQEQSGMALIAVLLFLILIAIAGLVAIRQSTVDLKVAASDQASALMLNSSDSILADIEQAAYSNDRRGIIMSTQKGVFGHFLVNTNEKIGDQVAFCYKPSNANLFALSTSRIRKFNGFLHQGADGICDSGKASSYVSARNTVMTQVAIRGLDIESRKPFSDVAIGEQTGKGQTDVVPKISMYSVSVIPALSNAKDSEIKACLEKPAGDSPGNYGADKNITQCLKDIGVPATTLVEDGALALEYDGRYDDSTGEIKNICLDHTNCKAAFEAK